MKRSIKTWALVAVAAMGLTACQNDIDEQIEAKDSVVVTFVADSADTRTSVDTSGDTPVFAWEDYEYFTVLEQTDALAMATSMGGNSVTYENVDGKAHISATFDYNAGKDEYKYVTVYPQFGYVKAESINAVTLMLPANQEMLYSDSYGDADLMVSEVVTTTEQPTEAQMVRFTRLAAVVQLSLKNLAEGENVESVIFEAEGKQLAGQIVADLENPHDFEAGDVTSSSVTVTPHHETTDNIFYFTVLPTTLAEGDAYTVTVVTDKHLYVKQGTIGEGKTLEFQSGMVTRVGVNMSGVTASDKWVLVTDVEELNGGDVVTFAAQKFNRVMGAQSLTNYPYASNTLVVKSGNYLYHPISNEGITMVQKLILDKVGDNTFYFFNDVDDYDGDTKTGYLCTANSNGSAISSTYKQLKLLAYPNVNTLFTVTIADDGVATIIAESSEYDNKYVQYVDGSLVNSSYNYFKCLKVDGEATEETAICLYKLEGAEPAEIPVPDANITISSSSSPLVIEKDGVQEETSLDKVKFNYVGDWTIDVSAKVKDSEDVAEWLAFTYADGALTYTAEANEGEVRYATVTITATLDGEEDIVKSFEVIQKGAPKTISIAEFVKLSTDANVEYIITGKLTEITKSNSGTFTLVDADGNEATIIYLYDENNTNQVYNNTAISLEVGDVVSVRTTVTGSAKGGSSSAHAIYLGHYNISATATPEIVSYEGGEATITITKEGNLEPETITSEVSGDATLTHEDGAFSATVEFEANTGVPREAVVTFTSGLITTTVAISQSADPANGTTWELVTDPSTLAEGDKVIIAAKESSMALGEPNTSKSRSAVAVEMIADGRYLNPAVGVQSFILKKGTTDNTFAFYDENQKDFLVSTAKSSSSYYLETQSYPDDNTYFTVGETICNPSGDYAGNILYYHTTKTLFYSGTSEKEVAYLYKLAGGEGTIPTIDAVVEVPAEDTRLSIVAEATTVETLIEDVEFIYTDGWEISVSANEDWLHITYKDGKLYYTADANEGVFRDAVVTIYANLVGDVEKKELGTFNVRQKGVPMEISIANFIAKTVAETDVTYKITGVISALPTSSTSAFKLKDGNGNEVQITYLKTQDGSAYVYNNNEVSLKVGDVVTVYTVLTGTVTISNVKYGKGGSNTYPSYYQGHYRLTTTTTGDVTYQGGDVTINAQIDKYGDIAAPTTISAEKNDANGVLTSYSFDGSTANLTFGENTTENGRSASVTFTADKAYATVSFKQDVNPEVKKGGWWLVTDVSELEAGDNIIIAATEMDYAISTATNSSRRKSTSITKDGNKLKEPSSDVQQYALEVDANGLYSFKGTLGTNVDNYIYAASSSSDYLKVKTTLDDSGKWTIAIDGAGAATIISQGTYAYNQMQYDNTVVSAPNFICTKDGSKGAVCLYKYYAAESAE